jgi:Gpi16 subunit, GPI transamidase component
MVATSHQTASGSNSNSNNISDSISPPQYIFQENIQRNDKSVSAELFMVWSPGQGTTVHPFSRLQQAWIKNNNIDDDASSLSLLSSGTITQVKMSVASQASEDHPSGFRLQIISQQSLTAEQLNQLTTHWQDSRLLTTPLKGGVWDHTPIYIVEDASSPSIAHPRTLLEYQLFLPLLGVAWSADALQQSFSSLPCPNLFGISAIEWSRLLVEGSTTNKHTWITWNQNKEGQVEVRSGISFDSLLDLPQMLRSEKSSCPFATRSMEPLPDSPPTATLEQVVRRPTPNQGRLETWFESSEALLPTIANCSFRLRQRLPHYFEPQWQSLQVLSSLGDDAEDLVVSVQWNENDLGSILTISHSQRTPQSLTVALEYQPAFLAITDFPGDPNRGRELPPAVMTVVCPNDHPQFQRSFFSNSVLILPPVPDMSMPFNVLSLSCSLYAYLIGTIMTLAIRKASERVKYRLHPEQKPSSPLQKLKSMMRSKFIAKSQSQDTSTTNTVPKEDGGGDEVTKGKDEIRHDDAVDEAVG